MRRSDEFEVGYPAIEITEDGQKDPLLTGLAPRQRILQWHEDTFDMPKGAVQLMTGATIRNQAFRFGRTTYGFQCHFEVSPELAKQWFSQWGHTIVRRYEEQVGAPGARARAGRDRAPRRARRRFLPRGDPALGDPGAGRAQGAGGLIPASRCRSGMNSTQHLVSGGRALDR